MSYIEYWPKALYKCPYTIAFASSGKLKSVVSLVDGENTMNGF